VRTLIIKTSSLGDVLHTLPAVSDAAAQCPGMRFDWVVEEAFAEVPGWHAAVDEVIPVALRRWRHRPFHMLRLGEPQAAVRHIRQREYDQVIDAQGLMKSAVMTRLARGPRAGLDRHSARRVRQLFAAALDYPLPDTAADYGIQANFIAGQRQPYLVFLHGTTWPTKHWPEPYWVQLTAMASAAGLQVKIPWGNDQERRRAERIGEASGAVEVLPRMTLSELATVIVSATAVVGVDTGLVHLAAALSTPCITLYGSTDPGLIGTLGESQAQLRAAFPCSPCQQRICSYTGKSEIFPACYGTLDAHRVWAELDKMLAEQSA
jgi:heptosyltransferase-1